VNKFRKPVSIFLQKSTLALTKNRIKLKTSTKCLFTSILIFALSYFSLTKAQISDGKINLSIKKGTAKIENKKFKSHSSFSMSDVESVLGKANRVKDGYNSLHTYDKLGVVFFENKSTSVINEVQIFIVPDKSLEFCPKNTFSGSFNIENLNINKNTSLDAVKHKLKKYKFEKSLLGDNSYRGEFKHLYVFIKFKPDNSGAEKISFGLK
jgi:hypothetical protein